MAIEFRCPQCQKLLRVGDDAAGKQAKCPACSALAMVPEALTESPPPAPYFTPLPSFPAAGNPFATGADAFRPGGSSPPFGPASDNPYAAPLTSGASSAGFARPTQISINGVFDDAWPTFKENMGMLIAVFFVEFIVVQAVNFGTAIPLIALQGLGGDEALIVLVALARALAIALVAIWMSCGRDLYYLQTAKGQSPPFSVMFSGHPILLRRFLLMIVVMFANIIAFLPAVIAGFVVAELAGDEEAGVVVGLVIGALSIVPWVWAMLTYFQAWYVYLDQPVGLMEGIRVSGKITPGNRLSLFALGVIAGLLMLAGACACYVGLFFTAPLAYMLAIIAYLQMTGQPVRGHDRGVPRHMAA